MSLFIVIKIGIKTPARISRPTSESSLSNGSEVCCFVIMGA